MLKNNITIDDKPLLDEYLNSFDYKTSGLSFTSLYMWRNLNDFKFEIINDYLLISGKSHLEINDPEPFLFPPLTKTGCYDFQTLSDTINIARKIFENKGFIFSIRLLPFHMIECIEKAKPLKMEFISDRPNYDYVYLSKDLIELKGKKFHSKKNHLNYFKSNNSYEYLPLSSQMAEECLELNERLNKDKVLDSHEMELLKMEEEALKDVFINFEKAGYLGGAIKINNKIEAFTIGGHLGKKSMVVHVEKANTEFRGLYQAINNEFCRHVCNTCKYINREEDMGIPGLRKAKISYRPVKYIEKYIAMFKEDM